MLGPLEVVQEGTTVRLGGPKQRAVLAVLLVHANATVSAERLIDLVWGDSPPANALGALHVYVSHLRKALQRKEGAAPASSRLLTGPGGYTLVVEDGELDSAGFEALVEGGRNDLAKKLPRAASAKLRRALGLWRGPPLADLPEISALEAESARLQELRVAAFEYVIEAELAGGRHAVVVSELEMSIEQHPLRERLRHQYILALYRCGRQADALSAFDDARRFLANELGLDPSPELQRLQRAVLQHDHALDWRPQDAEPELPVVFDKPARRSPFVGRDAERAAVADALARAAHGNGSVFLVGGEPGIGKTRFAEEVGADSADRGFLALTGQCHESEEGRPYAPFAEIIEALCALVRRDDLSVALGEEAPELARLVPALRHWLPGLAEPLVLPPEQERAYLFSAVRRMLERLTTGRPLVLVLEDLHWCDLPTALLLQHIAQYASRLPLVVIGTYRDVELEPSRPFPTILEDLYKERLAQRMHLRRLDRDQVATIVRELARKDPPYRAVELIFDRTDGNPFFVEELFAHLTEEGKLVDERGEFRPLLDLDEAEVPEGIRLVLGRRLQRLSASAHEVLRVAAVIGRVFSYDVLAEVTAEGSALEAVEEAVKAHLIIPTNGALETHFSFAHELVRQSLLTELSAPRRQRLHLRVAEVLEQRGGADGEATTQIANHLYRAGTAADPHKTARYLRLAGRRAYEAAAHEDALELFENALGLWDEGDEDGRGELLVDLALGYRSIGRLEDALSAWRDALQIYERRGEAERAGDICFDASGQLGWAGRWGDSFEMIQRGLALCGERPSSTTARLLASYGSLAAGLGDVVTGQNVVERARQMAEEIGDDRLSAITMFARCLVMLYSMEAQESARAGRRAAELLRDSADRWTLAEGLNFLAYSLVHSGQWDEADRVVEEGETETARLGHHSSLIWLRRHKRIMTVGRTGDIAAYAAAARDDEAFCREIGHPYVGQALAAQGVASFWQGEWDVAIAKLEEAAALELPPAWSGGLLAFLLIVRSYRGDFEETRTILAEQENDLARAGAVNTHGHWLLLLAAVECYDVMGDKERAAALYPGVVAALETGTVSRVIDARLSEGVAGIAAAAGKRWAEAERHFETALAQAEELPVVIERSEVRRFYARMLLERNEPDDAERAEALLKEAATGYEGLSMRRHVVLTREILESIGRVSPPTCRSGDMD